MLPGLLGPIRGEALPDGGSALPSVSGDEMCDNQGMTPQERISNDLKAAMKAKDLKRRDILRMLLSDIKNKKIELGAEVDEDTFVAVVRRAVKQRHESESQYRDGGRPELAEKEAAEAEVLEAYLPQQVGDDVILAAVEEFVAAEALEKSPKSIGVVMKAMMARFGTSADGASVNRAARKVLTG